MGGDQDAPVATHQPCSYNQDEVGAVVPLF
jgi:hypothetical protein